MEEKKQIEEDVNREPSNLSGESSIVNSEPATGEMISPEENDRKKKI